VLLTSVSRSSGHDASATSDRDGGTGTVSRCVQESSFDARGATRLSVPSTQLPSLRDRVMGKHVEGPQTRASQPSRRARARCCACDRPSRGGAAQAHGSPRRSRQSCLSHSGGVPSTHRQHGAVPTGLRNQAPVGASALHLLQPAMTSPMASPRYAGHARAFGQSAFSTPTVGHTGKFTPIRPPPMHAPAVCRPVWKRHVNGPAVQ
jgi:hypothetical protein